ncbi:MAG: thioesterase family protein [Thermoplasmataceae archaeon]|jgi:acyl-CoA thioester hydrolase
MQSKIEIQVRYGDIDALGHVNNAVFLTYFELGRVDLLRRINDEFSADKAGIVIAHIEVDYRRPLLFDSSPILFTEVSAIGNKSITFNHRLVDSNGSEFASGKTVSVCVSEEGKAISVPEEWRKKLLI